MKCKNAFILLFVSSIPLFAEFKFTGKELEEIFLSLKQFTSSPEVQVINSTKLRFKEFTITKITLRSNQDTVNIKIEFNDDSTITHIGLNLFETDQTLYYDQLVYQFIERYLLVNFLNPPAGNKKPKSSDVNLIFNQLTFKLGNKDQFTELLRIIRYSGLFKIEREDLLFHAKWSDKSGNEVELQFPAQAEIITGKDKMELDKGISLKLSAYDSPSGTSSHNNNFKIDFYQLQPYTGDIKYIKGEKLVENLTNNKYYVTGGDTLVPLFDKRYESESINNIFTIPLDVVDELKLIVRHHMYGMNIEEYSTDFSSLLHLLPNYELFTGNELNNNNRLIILVFINYDLNNLHLVTLSGDIDKLFDQGPKVLNADIYTNIRTDNIKNIRKDYIDKKNKFKIKTN